MKVGIDLGTTNSALAYIDPADAEDSLFPPVQVFPIPQLVAAGRVEFHVALSVSTEMHAALTTMEKGLVNAVKSHDYGRVRSSATAMVYMVDAMEQMKITD